jgi:hypothetical protein
MSKEDLTKIAANRTDFLLVCILAVNIVGVFM